MLVPGRYETVSWRNDGAITASITVYVPSLDVIEFRYRFRPSSVAEWQDISQSISLERTACHYGGQRVWFSCSHCHRRVAKLYLHDERWCCRQSLRLVYPSQSECRLGRLIRRGHKLEARLFGDERKKRMHKATRERLIEEICWIDDQFYSRLARRYGAIEKDW
ncbi:MAG: hypothetical protein WBK91_02350 [Alphaproteobacteria bacterium]